SDELFVLIGAADPACYHFATQRPWGGCLWQRAMLRQRERLHRPASLAGRGNRGRGGFQPSSAASVRSAPWGERRWIADVLHGHGAGRESECGAGRSWTACVPSRG